jgi:hypothetical protein
MAGKRGGALPGPVWEWFWSKVDRQGPHDCWSWVGALNDSGYGAIWDGTRLVYAHRLSWVLHGGKIPDEFTIDHLCRNRACVESWVPPAERAPRIYKKSEETRARMREAARRRWAKQRGEAA